MKALLHIILLPLAIAGAAAVSAVESSSPPVALWAFPHGRSVTGTAYLGAVAYCSGGVSSVVFSVNGTPVSTNNSETLNPETGEQEFVLALDTTVYTNGAPLALTAAVYPLSTGSPPVQLPARTVWVNPPVQNIYYVDQSAGSDLTGTGSSGSPFATIGKAVSVAVSGDEIRLRNGNYHLGITTNRAFTRFVLIRADDGAGPRIISSDALSSGYLHFKGLTFDWSDTPANLPDNGVNGQIIGGWSKSHLRFEECSFQGPPGKYNSYLLGIKLWGSITGLTVERCDFHDLNVALAMTPGSIARGNHIYDITSDAFDFNSDTLITGNRIHGIDAPHLFIESTNAEPFSVAGLDLTFSYSEFNDGVYTNFYFADLGALVTNPAQATAAGLAQGFMADSRFSAKLEAAAANGRIRVTARRSNYTQRLYATGTANQALGFAYDSTNNQAVGSGQHADIFQTWGDSQSNVVIRNNRAYEVNSQGLLPQTHLSNLVFVNNLLNMFGDSWVVNFEKFDYRNILMVHNTFWGRRTALILGMTNAPVDFVIANNIFGPRGTIGDKVMPGLTMDYNLYDYYAPGGGEGPAAHSLWTNPDKLSPAATPLFLNVTSFYDTAISDYLYAAPDGDFSSNSNSPARNAGSGEFGVRYDLNWIPRDAVPDIGCYEYTAPGADTDGDGMPDSWEIQNRLNPANPADAALDTDRDGASNFSEYVAGTDSRDSRSRFTAGLYAGPSGAGVIFTSASSRTYSAEWCDDLVAADWLVLTNDVPGTGGVVSITDTNRAALRFYRLRVNLP